MSSKFRWPERSLSEAKDTEPIRATLLHSLLWALRRRHARCLRLCAEDSCKEGRVRFLSAAVPELNTKPCFTLEKQPKFYACGRLPASALLMWKCFEPSHHVRMRPNLPPGPPPPHLPALSLFLPPVPTCGGEGKGRSGCIGRLLPRSC